MKKYWDKKSNRMVIQPKNQKELNEWFVNQVFSPMGFKLGRNHPCPCMSGKKYKKCCWGK